MIVWCQWHHPRSRDQVMDSNSHRSSCHYAKLRTASQTTLHQDWAETKTQEELWMWCHHWVARLSSQSVVNPPTSYTPSLSAPDTPQAAILSISSTTVIIKATQDIFYLSTLVYWSCAYEHASHIRNKSTRESTYFICFFLRAELYPRINICRALLSYIRNKSTHS